MKLKDKVEYIFAIGFVSMGIGVAIAAYPTLIAVLVFELRPPASNIMAVTLFLVGFGSSASFFYFVFSDKKRSPNLVSKVGGNKEERDASGTTTRWILRILFAISTSLAATIIYALFLKGYVE